MLLLHGFPDFWFMWRHQIPLFAKAGYRAIALDLRGYNRSDAPAAISEYGSSHLAHDVERVMDTLRIERAAIVGHDWGGVVAWHFAARHPERVSKLVVINAPHPAAYIRSLLRTSQLLRSWYVFAFQIPRIPELLLTASRMKWLRRIWHGAAGDAGTVTGADVDKYAKAFSREGKVRAAVNYYRAAMRSAFRRERSVRIKTPTLIIWGGRDKFLVSSLPEATRRWVRNLRIHRLANYGHWPQLESPEEVNAVIVGFLGNG